MGPETAPRTRRFLPLAPLLVALLILLETSALAQVPPNVDCASATVIDADPNNLPFNDSLDVSLTDANDPNDPLQTCVQPASRNSYSVWYEFRPNAEGIALLSTEGSGYDTVLSVYTPEDDSCSAVSSQSELDCDDDTVGSSSFLAFQLAASKRVFINVTKFGGPTAGELRLRFKLDFAPGTSQCCVERPVPLCGVIDCEQCVCGDDPFCCSNEWDAVCVNLTRTTCASVCPCGTCGDGTPDFGEDCDPPGETVECDLDCTAAECGDGTLNPTAGEQCDDNNPDPCDGCSESCETETGFICGDGEVNAVCGEQCDDSNTDPCDGCDAFCQAEGFCGDGTLDPVCEHCDEGGETATCDSDCTFVVCGDGTLNMTASEQCDDNNADVCDGCSDVCQVETSFICGDGGVNAVCGEACDDNNAESCDGCSDTCQIETGYVCPDGVLNTACGEICDEGGDTPTCDSDCTPVECGDGHLNEPAGEVCDDSNPSSCDGCSDTCQPESGFACGDGEINSACGEICDDGNTQICDGCSDSCIAETGFVCGDGEINVTCDEQCDPPDDEICNPECRFFCGDGLHEPSRDEECDNGPDNGIFGCCLIDCVSGVQNCADPNGICDPGGVDPDRDGFLDGVEIAVGSDVCDGGSMPATFCRDPDDPNGFDNTVCTVDVDCPEGLVCRLKGPFNGRETLFGRFGAREQESFLTYQKPRERRTALLSHDGVSATEVIVVFGKTVDPDSFSVIKIRGREDLTPYFTPVIPGTARKVVLPLSARRCTRFRLQISGERSDGKIRMDRDRIVFIHP